MIDRVEPDDSPRESIGDYKYHIYCNDVLVARYWHDYCGDEHGIDFVNGQSEMWPVGRMTEFLKGGGYQPTVLSRAAEAYIQQRIGGLVACG